MKLLLAIFALILIASLPTYAYQHLPLNYTLEQHVEFVEDDNINGQCREHHFHHCVFKMMSA